MRQKGYAAINVIGLSIGVTFCLVIMLYVVNELSYERHFAKADRIYRIVQHVKWDGGNMDAPLTSAPFAPALVNDYPAIESAVRINIEGGGVIRVGENQLKVDDVFFADHTMFHIFDHSFLHGDPGTSLRESGSIVLTEELAEKLFGDASQALGKSVTVDNKAENIVTGVIANPPANSHLNFSAIRSLPPGYTTGWQEFALYTYVLLKEGHDIKTLEANLPAFFEKHLLKEMEPVNYRMELQPITSIHLHSHLEYEPGINGDIQYVYLFIAIAVLILLIACINYMNMATARSAQRAKEVGIRKTLGSDRTQLAALFVAESTIITLIAVVLAILLADLSLPLINRMMQLELSFALLGAGPLGLIAVVLVVVIGLISGSYPAFYLTSFKPVTALKGSLGSHAGKSNFRQVLVTFQFVVATILISCVWVVYQQLNYVNATELGFNKERTIYFHINDKATRLKLPSIKKKLLQHPGVEAVASASNPIGANFLGKAGLFLETNGVVSDNKNQLAQHLMIDEDFLQTMEIELMAGRNFQADYTTDQQQAVLINEALARKAGWADSLVDKQMKFVSDPQTNYKVIGVVKDFHTYSLHHQIEPLVMTLAPASEQDNVYLRISSSNIPATLAFIEKTYSEFDSANPIEVNFVDQTFAKQYQTVRQRGQLFLAFTLMTLFIACMGLFGLSAFAAEQRTKEIGIRKVLGASITDIVGLLSKDFFKLVMIAIVIASPFAWYLTHRWLEDFAYRIHINPLIFAAAGFITIVVALATVSLQAFKAAVANPVKSLRNE